MNVCCALLSKKDAAIRRKELLDVVSPALLDFLCMNAHTMVTDKATSVTVSDILASACGDLRPAMMAVAQLANQELVPGGTNGLVGFLKLLGFCENVEVWVHGQKIAHTGESLWSVLRRQLDKQEPASSGEVLSFCGARMICNQSGWSWSWSWS